LMKYLPRRQESANRFKNIFPVAARHQETSR
jgi:hypothetical protein